MQAQAGFQGQLELRDDGAGVDADDADVEAEVGEGLFQEGGPIAQYLILISQVERFGVFQEL